MTFSPMLVCSARGAHSKGEATAVLWTCRAIDQARGLRASIRKGSLDILRLGLA